jgi:hypothetical protein
MKTFRFDCGGEDPPFDLGIEASRRWTLEARLLAALIHRIEPRTNEVVIPEEEMEAVKGMIFKPAEAKTSKLVVLLQ